MPYHIEIGFTEILRHIECNVSFPCNIRLDFALFSKAGFTEGLRDDLNDDWRLFDLDDLDTLLSSER